MIEKLKSINIKTAIIIGVVIVLLGIAYSYKGLFIAATVNGSPISRFSIIGELEKRSGKGVLDALINRKLVESEALKKGITVSSDEINTEVKKVENQLQAQGQTLDQALSSQNMTRKDLENQISTEKKLEKLIADRIQITDSDIDKYIKDNSIEIPKDKEADYRSKIKDQLYQDKLNSEATSYISSLRTQASIKYFVNY